ncbi:unnamed protein product [Boreogadus saida]
MLGGTGQLPGCWGKVQAWKTTCTPSPSYSAPLTCGRDTPDSCTLGWKTFTSPGYLSYGERVLHQG